MSAIPDVPRHLFHLLAVGPLFVYVGLQRENKAYLKLKDGQSAWINWIHILLVAPLLLILGYLKKDANRRYFEMMLLLGFAAIGYHGLYLIREMIFN